MHAVISDLYSLGVTLHHLLTNQKPPQTVSRANDKLMNKPDPLRPVNEVNPLVPVEVAQVLSSALNFNPNLRPQSARAMRDMLKKAIQKNSVIKQPTLSLPLGVGLGVLLLLVGMVGGRLLFAPANNTPVATAPATEISIVEPTTITVQPTKIPVAPATIALSPTAAIGPTSTPSTPQATNTVKPTFSPTPTVSSPEPRSTQAPTESPSTIRTDGSGNIIHVVQPNEWVYDIARQYEGVSPQDILDANNLAGPDAVVPGQELIIPVK